MSGGTGILGGTFNPVHIGHIRHALEVGEALGLDRVLFSPCAVPPHKPDHGLLPFALRVDLIRVAVEGVARLGVSTLEGELAGPSYTWNFLTEWRRRHANEPPPFFLMGVGDFADLNDWHRGPEMVSLAHLVAVPRAGSDRELFEKTVRRLWPDAPSAVPAAGPAGRVEYVMPGGGRCLFLPVPRLDISASFIRQRWRQGRELHGLLPESSLRVLEEARSAVADAWADPMPIASFRTLASHGSCQGKR